MKCPLCASSNICKFAEWPEFSAEECQGCGFRFVDVSAPQYPRDAQYTFDESEIGPIRPQQPHIQRRVRDVLRYARPPGRALDLGCGKGEVALALREEGFECAGIDMKANLIGHLQTGFPDIDWRCATAADLAAQSARYDVLTLYHVLEHISDPRRALAGVKSIANPGALVVIEVPNTGGFAARIKGRRWHYYKIDHVNYFRESDLRRLAADLDMTVLAVCGYQHFSYPQDVLWKDLVKGALGWIGFRDVVSIFLRVK